MSNHLIHSTSPYLLQHANNPVNWYPWIDEALAKARREAKPIFLSIGYAACHWCHVMAHESFEDPETAALMNEHFINIKVDREERPDLDNIYMTSVVALSGQGGWPLSVFLTPKLQPFYGGTYFHPTPRYGKPSFKQVLIALAEAWKNQRDEIGRVGEQVNAALAHQFQASEHGGGVNADTIQAATRTLVQTYDWDHGGWGTAPKFPQGMVIEFLLRRHVAGDSQALEPAIHALRAMARGGMYDVIGGGFSRYSTDNEWHIPHFEKMLYNNALLARAYLHAWQVSGEAFFRRIAEETLDFVTRELTSPDGGFYSSLDADSEGEEGKFYLWNREEIRIALGDAYDFFTAAYEMEKGVDRQGRILLRRAADDEILAVRFGWPLERVASKIDECRSRLLAVRSNRARPATDDKVLTSWNGLMLAAFTEAARILDNSRYLEVATRNAHFLLANLYADGRLHRAWRQGKTSPEVFLEDYASLLLGLLELYQNDFNPVWFTTARQLAQEMIAGFDDPAGGFFDTHMDAASLLTRPKEVQDNATPSGNALAAEALLKLAALDGNPGWRSRAEQSLRLLPSFASRSPTAFSRWLSAADFSLANVKQVAVLGELSSPGIRRLLKVVRVIYRPNLVVAASAFPPPPESPALLKGRTLIKGKAAAYVCEGFFCRRPVTTEKGLQEQL